MPQLIYKESKATFAFSIAEVAARLASSPNYQKDRWSSWLNELAEREDGDVDFSESSSCGLFAHLLVAELIAHELGCVRCLECDTDYLVGKLTREIAEFSGSLCYAKVAIWRCPGQHDVFTETLEGAVP